jgi:ubiquitin C-terminal hydrolase
MCFDPSRRLDYSFEIRLRFTFYFCQVISENEKSQDGFVMLLAASDIGRNINTSSTRVRNLVLNTLRNLGNTCYMNATLQMICSLTGMMGALEQAEDKGGNLTKSVTAVAKELRIKPSAGDVSPVNPKAVKAAIDEKTDKFVGCEQRDAHEFVSDLVDHIHEELEQEKVSDEDSKTASDDVTTKSTPATPMDNFLLTVEVCLTCQSCGYRR